MNGLSLNKKKNECDVKKGGLNYLFISPKVNFLLFRFLIFVL